MKRLAVGFVCSLGLLATLTAVSAQGLLPSSNPRCLANKPPAFDVTLRADFNDLGPTVCPNNDPFQVIGATVSVADNLLTSKTSGAVDGLAALTGRIYGPAASTFAGLSAGLFVQVNDTYQFQSAPSLNSDSVTYGAFTQLVLNNDFGFDSFRLRGGEVTGSSGTNSKSLVAEWTPAYNLGSPISFGIPIPIPGSSLAYTLLPDLMVQYDTYESGPNKALIFSTSNQSLRIGPQLAMQFSFVRAAFSNSVDPRLADFLSATFATVTYHASEDVYSGRKYSWTSVSLSHSFNAYFGVTASFGSGASEGTGNLSRQAKAGVSIKF
jgi:hypothetical protein